MQNNHILNSKQIKKVLKILKEHYGAVLDCDYVFLQNKEGKLYIVNRDLSRIDESKLRINSIGLYFGVLSDDELRLTIDGSQIVGPFANKNILKIDSQTARFWLKGNDLEIETELNGYIIIKYNNDYLGCGKVTKDKILNFVPKTRRIMASD